MEIGVSTASLFLRYYNEDALAILNGIDSKVTEIFLESFTEYKKEFGLKLQPLLNGLKVNSLHVLTTQFEPQLFEPCDRARRDAFDMIKGVFELGEVVGAKYYILHGKAYFKKTAKFNQYEFYGKSFNELCDLAEKYGMEICLENVEWAFYRSIGFFSRMKKFCPRLKGCLDIKQARLSGVDYTDYIKEMKGAIATVHLSDYDENGKIVLPGKGLFDFEKLFKELKAVGFDGNALIEVYKDSYENIDELKESLYYLRKIKERVYG